MYMGKCYFVLTGAEWLVSEIWKDKYNWNAFDLVQILLLRWKPCTSVLHGAVKSDPIG